MVNANMTNWKRTHTGHFTINIAFAEEIWGLTRNNFVFMPIDGNGIENIIFQPVMGKERSYIISVEVPIGVKGSFQTSIVGQVTALREVIPENGEITEPTRQETRIDVRANKRIYQYDTTDV